MDDQPSVCEAMVMILKADSHEVKTFTDPRDAAKYLESDNFDIAFVDLQMPFIPGSKMVGLIKSRHPAKPIVILAAQPISPGDLGANRLLLKPFSAEELRRTISELVG